MAATKSFSYLPANAGHRCLRWRPRGTQVVRVFSSAMERSAGADQFFLTRLRTHPLQELLAHERRHELAQAGVDIVRNLERYDASALVLLGGRVGLQDVDPLREPGTEQQAEAVEHRVAAGIGHERTVDGRVDVLVASGDRHRVGCDANTDTHSSTPPP